MNLYATTVKVMELDVVVILKEKVAHGKIPI